MTFQNPLEKTKAAVVQLTVAFASLLVVASPALADRQDVRQEIRESIRSEIRDNRRD